MKSYFLIFCALLTSVNIAKADTMETMRMYDKSLSKVLVEAARDGSFIDLDKIGRSIDIPELAHEINRTANHTIKNDKQFNSTYHVNQDPYQQYGIRSISFAEWSSEKGKMKQLEFELHNNRCPLPPTNYEEFAGSPSFIGHLDGKDISILTLPAPAKAKLLFMKKRKDNCAVMIVQEFVTADFGPGIHK